MRRHSPRRRAAAVLVAGLFAMLAATAQDVPGDYLNRRYSFSAPPPLPAQAIAVPQLQGRLTARDIGLVINTADPYSVEVGEFYARARQLAPAQVLRLELPVRGVLTPGEFDELRAAVAKFFGKRGEALALAWKEPYAVGCNSITGALALGYDADLCHHPCAASGRSPYFNHRSARPWTELKMRPSMLLAAHDAEGAKAMIRRGKASDGRLGLRGGPPANAWFLRTSDTVRSARAAYFPPAGPLPRFNVDVRVEQGDAPSSPERVLVYETGLPRVAGLDRIDWLPGALADHLTSFGGVLDGSTGQMPATDWIASGATASYGSVSEPCAHPQKFPHSQVLLLNYLQGATAIEAYWKSVAWPQQGLFIGEPLAAPFARR